jgi:hypothetical protein
MRNEKKRNDIQRNGTETKKIPFLKKKITKYVGKKILLAAQYSFLGI